MTALYPGVKLGFVGVVGGFERPLVTSSTLPFVSYDEVRAGPLNGVGLLRRLRSVFELAIGIIQAWFLMARRRPDVILLTGGWCGFPVSIAGWLWRAPMLIYLPDIEPALTIKALRPFARRVALTAEASRQFFPNNDTIVTGYPVRQALRMATRDEAQRHFKLDPARKTLLVMGGSRGARAINNALLDMLPELLKDGIQIIHITGTLDWAEIEAWRNAMPDATHYHAFPYLHGEMGLALAAADLAVSRAGASVLGEFPIFGIPAVLIPLPYFWHYQRVNADYLVEKGAALRLDESKLADELLPTLRGLLNDSAQLAAMSAAARAAAPADGAANAARELAQLAGGTA